MTPKEQVEKFLNDTQDARFRSHVCRDYYDHKQWTADEERKLRARHQAPIVVNRVRPKVEGLVGLYNLRSVDPKAYPRTQKHEKSAEAVTDGLRYVVDNTHFQETTRLDVANDFFVEGYGGAWVTVEDTPKGKEIVCDRIPWDRIEYDPHSRRLDFADSRWFGIFQWMYKEEFEETFPDADWDQVISGQNGEDETIEDKPLWADKKANRARVSIHFYIKSGKWKMCIFSGDYKIVKEQDSPYKDEDGLPSCPIELVSANIDREGNRYGEVTGFLSQQDEINHRRSKFLHYLNQNRTYARKGAIKDPAALKREMAKPDGHVESEGVFGEDWGIFENMTAENGQFTLYQDAKAELDSTSFNAQLSGERQSGDLSGKAIDRLQQAGTIELNRQYALLTGWELRIYRQIWARIKQHWTEEKWIRVTDDYDSLRWVGLNAQVTTQQFLEEQINDESLPVQQRTAYAATFKYMMETQDPRLQQVIEIANPVPEMDMDIILDQSFDVVNIQQEQFNMLAQFANGNDVDLLDLLELSEIRGKDELIEKIERRRAQMAQANAGAVQIDQADKMAGIKVKESQAEKNYQDSVQKAMETHTLATNPEIPKTANINT